MQEVGWQDASRSASSTKAAKKFRCPRTSVVQIQ
jgi:hypothetical protein